MIKNPRKKKSPEGPVNILFIFIPFRRSTSSLCPEGGGYKVEKCTGGQGPRSFGSVGFTRRFSLDGFTAGRGGAGLAKFDLYRRTNFSLGELLPRSLFFFFTYFYFFRHDFIPISFFYFFKIPPCAFCTRSFFYYLVKVSVFVL